MGEKTDVYYKIIGSKKAIANYRYSRKVRTTIQRQYNGRYDIIILEGPDKYWIYDEDALKVAVLFQFDPFKTRKGHTIVYDKSIHEDIIADLIKQGLRCVIVTPEKELTVSASAAKKDDDLSVKIGVIFKMRDASGTAAKYIIKRPAYSRTLLHLGNGCVGIQQTPIVDDFDDMGVQVITHQAPLALLLVGKHIGETVEYNGESYTIVEIGDPSL